jgi:hypothetical protein
MLTYRLFKTQSSCQQQAGLASQMLTYILFKTQSMLLSATSRKGQPDADSQSVKNPEHALVSDKQEGSARCSLTFCSKFRAYSFQQQAERSSQMLTYRLFKTQSMLFSATSRKGQPDADLHSVQNQEHALVRNRQEGPAIFQLTFYSKPRPFSCQQQAGGQPAADLQTVQNPENALVRNRQKGPARC